MSSDTLDVDNYCDLLYICSTTGARDPVTSALHIILGKRVHLDIAQVVRWKETHASIEAPCVRYAASFAGYSYAYNW